MTMSQTNLDLRNQSLNSIRRLVLHGLLFVLLIVFAIGLSTLLTVAFSGFKPEFEGSTQLATGLSFTLIAGPLAWILWRSVRTKLQSVSDTDASIWSLQAAAIYLISLIASSVSLLAMLSGLASTPSGFNWQPLLGTALGWGVVFCWQYSTIQNPKYAPTALTSLAKSLGAVYSVVLAAATFGLLLQSAVQSFMPEDAVLLGSTDLTQLIARAIWALGAIILWWWHWFVMQAREAADPFADFIYMLFCLVLPALVTLLSLTALLNLSFPLPWDSISWSERFVADGSWAIAGILVGLIVWIYHHSLLVQRDEWTANLYRQIVSGIALAMTASGLGMVINSLLTSIAPNLLATGSSSTLRLGISMLLVGAVAWNYFFRPFSPADSKDRRVYLVLFFGISSLVALVALLVLGYRVFNFLLHTADTQTGLMWLIASPLSWLIATLAVATYHFELWRSDRKQLASAGQEAPATPAVVIDPAVSHPTRTLMVVAPHGSQLLLDGLQDIENMQFHWVPSNGAAPTAQAQTRLVTQIHAKMEFENNGLMVSIDSTGSAHFVQLAISSRPSFTV